MMLSHENHEPHELRKNYTSGFPAVRLALLGSAWQVALYVDTVMHNCTLSIETFAEVYSLSGKSITSILPLGINLA